MDTDSDRDAYRRWRACVLPNNATLFETLMADGCPRQQSLMHRVYNRAEIAVGSADERCSTHRSFLSLPGAKDWLTCPPTIATCTQIADPDFRLWLKFHCGLRLFDDATRCPRPICGQMGDDQLLTCPHRIGPGDAPGTWRHDLFVVIMAAPLRRARRSAVIEPRGDWATELRLYIRTEGISGGTDFLDVPVHHRSTGSTDQGRTIPAPSRILNGARSSKRKKYADFIRSQGARTALHPIALTTLDEWHPDSHTYVKEVCRSIASTTRVRRDFETNLVLGRIAANLLMLSCRALTEGALTGPP